MLLGRQLAMHVAAANPQAVDPSGLDPAAVAREKDVLAEKSKAQGKPNAIIEKIVKSGLKTYYKEVCLLDQAYIHDDKKNVAQALKEAQGKVGGPIKVTGFVRYKLGEGVEKQESDSPPKLRPPPGPRTDGRHQRARRVRMAKPASKTTGQSASKLAYRRVIVKVSGEALSGPAGFGIRQPTIDRIAKDLIAARRL